MSGQLCATATSQSTREYHNDSDASNAIWATILELAAVIESGEEQDVTQNSRYAEACERLTVLVDNPAVVGGITQALRTLWACWGEKE